MNDIIKDSERVLVPWFHDPLIAQLVILLTIWTIIGILVRGLRNTVHRMAVNPDAARIAKRLIGFFGYVLGVVTLAAVFKDKLGGLTVALGVTGAGIAFALQEVIVSLAGWMAVSLGAFYRVGDRVSLGGIRGDVIEVGLLRTTIMEIGDWVKGDLYNGRIVRVANSFVFKEPVFNYSGEFPFLWDEVVVPIKYGSDWKGFQADLLAIASEVVGDYVATASECWSEMVKTYQIEDASTEPMVALVVNDNWIEFTLRYVVDYKRRRAVKSLLFQRILETVDASQGRIGIASATFHLVEAPPLNVVMQRRNCSRRNE